MAKRAGSIHGRASSGDPVIDMGLSEKNGSRLGAFKAEPEVSATPPTPELEQIKLYKLKKQRIHVRVRGTSELCVHRFDEKAMQEMLDQQMGKAKKSKSPKDPLDCFLRCFHFIGDRPKNGQEVLDHPTRFRYGFPAVGFKSAMVDAASQLKGVTKVFLRGAFHIPCDLVEIEGVPEMRQDMVRVGMGTADIRFRPTFKEWTARVPIVFNPAVITSEILTNLMEQAGFSVGIGEWRPARDGSFGMFEVEATEN